MSQPRTLQRHLNTLRWVVLISVFMILVFLPFIHLYQTYKAAHAYDFLSSGQKLIYNSVETVTRPFTNDPVNALDAVKGTTWSGQVFGFRFSDPLAWVATAAATLTLSQKILLTILVPVILTLILGRFYCGWLCPATLLYELNDNLGTFLRRLGVPVSHRKWGRQLKYWVLGMGILLSAVFGVTLFASIYPPAIIGREIYYLIAQGGFGIGILFIVLTLLFDLMVVRRGFCRYVCPGGALYSLLGARRLLRIQRDVKTCNDCARCNSACQFGLDPLRDNFGMECNNCSACIASCPTDALSFQIRLQDIGYQGPGHLGKHYVAEEQAPVPATNTTPVAS